MSQELESVKRELELCRSDEIVKEAALIELRRQWADLVKCRSIEVNVLLNKPTKDETDPKQPSSAETKKNGKVTKAQKNLQKAKELNDEMELMFKDEDFKIKKRRRDNSKINKQQLSRQVQFAD